MSETPAAPGSTQTISTEVTATYPLTPMQLGMLVDSNLADRPWVDIEQIVYRLDDEPIDVAALEAGVGRRAAQARGPTNVVHVRSER